MCAGVHASALRCGPLVTRLVTAQERLTAGTPRASRAGQGLITATRVGDVDARHYRGNSPDLYTVAAGRSEVGMDPAPDRLPAPGTRMDVGAAAAQIRAVRDSPMAAAGRESERRIGPSPGRRSLPR